MRDGVFCFYCVFLGFLKHGKNKLYNKKRGKKDDNDDTRARRGEKRVLHLAKNEPAPAKRKKANETWGYSWL